jgi:hypothetical protein
LPPIPDGPSSQKNVDSTQVHGVLDLTRRQPRGWNPRPDTHGRDPTSGYVGETPSPTHPTKIRRRAPLTKGTRDMPLGDDPAPSQNHRGDRKRAAANAERHHRGREDYRQRARATPNTSGADAITSIAEAGTLWARSTAAPGVTSDLQPTPKWAAWMRIPVVPAAVLTAAVGCTSGNDGHEGREVRYRKSNQDHRTPMLDQ